MQNFPHMAADRLTQLQDAVNLQAENFCNSIGALQATAKESPFPEFRMNKNDSNNESSDVDCVNENNNNNPTTVDLINSKLSTINEMVASTLLNASGNVSSSSPSPSTTTSTPATTTAATTSTMSSPSSKLSSPSPLVSSQQLDNNIDDKISAKPTSNNSTNDVNIDSNDSNTPTSSAPIVHEDYSQMFARLVARTAKDIDTLVESLPNTFETEAGSSDLHSESIKQLEEENAECIVKLERAIEHGESILDMIREALDDIAMTQFRSQNLDELEQN